MHVWRVVVGWVIAVSVYVTAGQAKAQFQAAPPVVVPLTPPVVIRPVQVAPALGSGLTTITPTPSLKPVIAVPVGAPVPSHTSPAPVAATGQAQSAGTVPEPPEVRQNPPVLPYHRDDDKLPRSPRPGDKDDPLWMYRAMDKLANERPDLFNPGSQSQPPPPPPAAPKPTASKAETGGRSWWILIAVVVIGAYSFGRKSRAR